MRYKRYLLSTICLMSITLLLMGLMLLPEFVFNLLDMGFRPNWNPKELAIFFVVNLLLVLSRKGRINVYVVGFFYLLQLTALMHFSYYGSFYSPAHIPLVFEDIAEITESGLSAWKTLSVPLIIVAISFAAYLAIYSKYRDKNAGTKVARIPLYLLLIFPSVQAHFEDNSQHFEPDAESTAMKNGLYSFSFFLGNELPGRITGRYKNREYLDYAIQHDPKKDKVDIILVLGESTNPDYWEIYGYQQRNNNNLLKLLNKQDLHIRRAISSGVSTRVAVPMFMNVQREPDNFDVIRYGKTSLFRLAKQAGYQTIFISAQKMNGISSSLHSASIDHWVDVDSLHESDELDHKIIDRLEKYKRESGKPAFIVLNPRCCHSPYRKFKTDTFMYDEMNGDSVSRIRDYAGAMAYLDEFLGDLIRTQVLQSNKETLFVFISDHGQLLGEEGLWGHNHLNLATAMTPLLTLGNGSQSKSAARNVAGEDCLTNHYEIGKRIGAVMGYKIENANDDGDTYYVNGVDLAGRAGSLDYSISNLRQRYCRVNDR